MTEEQALAVLRAAERCLQTAWSWLPYWSDLADAPEEMRQKRNSDDQQLDRDAQLIRKRLRETEAAILNVAETKGSKTTQATASPPKDSLDR